MFPQRIGRYEIVGELGRGGMATVYLARDPHFQRDVALKALPREFLHDPNFRRRFEREALTIAALEHPAIVPVYDYGQDGEQPYIVMRYMAGGSLADRLKHRPIPPMEAARLLSLLAPALDAAHVRGVIHRDLKPANILFDQHGNPHISDFGLVKLSESAATVTGSVIVGTPAYMSPEQARGDIALDVRSDIYSLGVILFEMLTGALPYKADTPIGVAVKHITEPVPRVRVVKPDLPPGCEMVIGRALAKAPGQRFDTAQEMAVALEMVVGGGRSPTGLEADTPTVRLPGASQRGRRKALAGWALVGPLLLGLVSIGLAAALIAIAPKPQATLPIAARSATVHAAVPFTPLGRPSSSPMASWTAPPSVPSETPAADIVPVTGAEPATPTPKGGEPGAPAQPLAVASQTRSPTETPRTAPPSPSQTEAPPVIAPTATGLAAAPGPTATASRTLEPSPTSTLSATATRTKTPVPPSPTPTVTDIPAVPTQTNTATPVPPTSTATPSLTPVPPTASATPSPTLTATDTTGAPASYSLRFDGVNDIVRTRNIPLLKQFTIEVWVQRTADSGQYETYLADATRTYSQGMFALYIDGGSRDCRGAADQFAYFQPGGSLTLCSDVTADLGVWHHIAVSRDSAGTLRMFVDGVLRASQASSPEPHNSKGVLTLGRAGQFDGEYFAGLLDEVRICTEVMYAEDFTPPTMPLTAGSVTVALWHLDEGAGQVTADASGNGRDGTLGTNGGADPADPRWVTDSVILNPVLPSP